MNSSTAPSNTPLLAVMLAGIFIATMDTAIINVAAPSIRSSLGAGDAEIQFVVASYILTYGLLLITAARSGDTFGYGRVFFAGTIVFTAASLACGLAPNALVLILARAAQGTGAAFMVAQVLRGIQTNFSGQARTSAIGSYAIALSVGAVAGQIFGGALVYADLFGTSWRPVFLVNVPLGLIILAASTRFLPMQRGTRTQSLDLLGVLTLSVALLLVLVPLILGRDQSWPAWTWISLFLSLPALALFVFVERRISARGGDPLVNLPILARPPVAWGLLSTSLALGTYFAMLFILALYLQEGLDKTPLYSGLALISWVAAFGISGQVIKRVRQDRLPRFSAIGFLILAAVYFGIGASLALGVSSQVLLITLLGFGGLGFGLGRSTAVVQIINNVPDRYASDISGVINTCSQIFGVAGIAAFGAIYLGLGPQGGVQPAQDAFMFVNGALALTALIAAGAARLSLLSVGSVAHPIEPDLVSQSVTQPR